MDATNFYGQSLIQILPYDEVEMRHGHPDLYMSKLEEFLNTPDDRVIAYFIEVDLLYPDIIKQEPKTLPFCPENKLIHEDKYNEYMKKIKPKNFTKAEKLICDWTDKKNYLIHYRMLKFHVRHGMIVDKIHEIISPKQSKWLVKYKNFKTQKRSKSKIKFEKDFYKLLNNAFYGKAMENVRK